MTAIRPLVTCEQQVDVCLYNPCYNLIHYLNEQRTLQHHLLNYCAELLSVSLYIMS